MTDFRDKVKLKTPSSAQKRKHEDELSPSAKKKRKSETESRSLKTQPKFVNHDHIYKRYFEEKHMRSGKENLELFFRREYPFSQHHPAEFIIGGRKFNCAEQYYIYRKAVLFQAKDIEEQILNTDDPKEQKQLGQQIENFDFKTWMKHSIDIVRQGNLAKFSQNPHLKKQLFATHPRLLVEASPDDTTWGIGLDMTDPAALDMRSWKGENLLGFTITEVREELMAQDPKGERNRQQSGEMDDVMKKKQGKINCINSENSYLSRKKKLTRVGDDERATTKSHPEKGSQDSEADEEGRTEEMRQNEHHDDLTSTVLSEDGRNNEKEKGNVYSSHKPSRNSKAYREEGASSERDMVSGTEDIYSTAEINFLKGEDATRGRDDSTSMRDDSFSRKDDFTSGRDESMRDDPTSMRNDSTSERDVSASWRGPEDFWHESCEETESTRYKRQSTGTLSKYRQETFHANNRPRRSESCMPQMSASFHSHNLVYAHYFDNMLSGEDNLELFFGYQSPFSQHHLAMFVIDGIKFNCAEQYCMYRKAVLFKARDIADHIMNTDNPMEQKQIGQQIKNFRFKKWMEHSVEVMRRGNMAKFSQNPHLKRKLFATTPRILGEANPRDTIWGIGLHKKNPAAWDMRNWRGDNLLGFTITEVREELMRLESQGEKWDEEDLKERRCNDEKQSRSRTKHGSFRNRLESNQMDYDNDWRQVESDYTENEWYEVGGRMRDLRVGSHEKRRQGRRYEKQKGRVQDWWSRGRSKKFEEDRNWSRWDRQESSGIKGSQRRGFGARTSPCGKYKHHRSLSQPSQLPFRIFNHEHVYKHYFEEKNLVSGEENMELFFGFESPFSQHHPVQFEIDGRVFNCAEQYYMFRKAVLFEAKDIEEQIMNTDNPKKQKRLGRQIENFDFQTWMEHSVEVVKRGNMAKFSQNPHLQDQLFATHPRLMVEASPFDRTWGIGLDKADPAAWDMRTWKGENLLGFTITEVREELMGQEQRDRWMGEESRVINENKSSDEYGKDKSNSRSDHEDSNNNSKEHGNDFDDKCKDEEGKLSKRDLGTKYRKHSVGKQQRSVGNSFDTKEKRKKRKDRSSSPEDERWSQDSKDDSESPGEKQSKKLDSSSQSSDSEDSGRKRSDQERNNSGREKRRKTVSKKSSSNNSSDREDSVKTTSLGTRKDSETQDCEKYKSSNNSSDMEDSVKTTSLGTKDSETQDCEKYKSSNGLSDVEDGVKTTSLGTKDSETQDCEKYKSSNGLSDVEDGVKTASLGTKNSGTQDCEKYKSSNNSSDVEDSVKTTSLGTKDSETQDCEKYKSSDGSTDCEESFKVKGRSQRQQSEVCETRMSNKNYGTISSSCRESEESSREERKEDRDTEVKESKHCDSVTNIIKVKHEHENKQVCGNKQRRKGENKKKEKFRKMDQGKNRKQIDTESEDRFSDGDSCKRTKSGQSSSEKEEDKCEEKDSDVDEEKRLEESKNEEDSVHDKSLTQKRHGDKDSEVEETKDCHSCSNRNSDNTEQDERKTDKDFKDSWGKDEEDKTHPVTCMIERNEDDNQSCINEQGRKMKLNENAEEDTVLSDAEKELLGARGKFKNKKKEFKAKISQRNYRGNRSMMSVRTKDSESDQDSRISTNGKESGGDGRKQRKHSTSRRDSGERHDGRSRRDNECDIQYRYREHRKESVSTKHGVGKRDVFDRKESAESDGRTEHRKERLQRNIYSETKDDGTSNKNRGHTKQSAEIKDSNHNRDSAHTKDSTEIKDSRSRKHCVKDSSDVKHSSRKESVQERCRNQSVQAKHHSGIKESSRQEKVHAKERPETEDGKSKKKRVHASKCDKSTNENGLADNSLEVKDGTGGKESSEIQDNRCRKDSMHKRLSSEIKDTNYRKETMEREETKHRDIKDRAARKVSHCTKTASEKNITSDGSEIGDLEDKSKCDEVDNSVFVRECERGSRKRKRKSSTQMKHDDEGFEKKKRSRLDKRRNDKKKKKQHKEKKKMKKRRHRKESTSSKDESMMKKKDEKPREEHDDDEKTSVNGDEKKEEKFCFKIESKICLTKDGKESGKKE